MKNSNRLFSKMCNLRKIFLQCLFIELLYIYTYITIDYIYIYIYIYNLTSINLNPCDVGLGDNTLLAYICYYFLCAGLSEKIIRTGTLSLSKKLKMCFFKKQNQLGY